MLNYGNAVGSTVKRGIKMPVYAVVDHNIDGHGIIV